MELTWDKRFEVGDDFIDAQHRMLVNIISRLAGLIEKKGSAEAVARVMHEIRKYAEFHFASEECFMFEIGYPGLALHEAVHSKLLGELSVRIGRVIHHKASGEEVLSYLYAWLAGHVEHEDSKYMAYLRAHRQKS
ncbi:MAG: bacteriohemerythrin [Proteobacteria bacterium]|nr:bacteriohemerythrin [Pseudomonadota bacterium]